uniref:Capping protein inhibiting regulator of actin dynamics n=1 Tax=Propithecus coquereli TaxID=379532 RepID=A0A2K6G9N8_PROCO
MGTRAFSHDSIFIPDGGAESEQTVQAMSQDNILGKVKTLQQQLGKNIKFGQRLPNAIPMKKAGSGEASLEEDLFPTSPMEIVTQQDIVLSDTENKSSDTPSSLSPLNLPAAGSEMEEKVAPVKPSRPKRHFSSAGTIESVNLDAIPLAIARLDNSAAKHKLAVKPKNQRVSKKHRRLARVPGRCPCWPGSNSAKWVGVGVEPWNDLGGLRRQEEEERKRAEKLRRQEEERKRAEGLRRQEEEATRLGEELSGREEMAQRRQEEEGPAEEVQLELEDRRGPRSPLQTDLEETPEDQENAKAKRQREIPGEQSPEAEPAGARQGQSAEFPGDERPALEEERGAAKTDAPQRGEGRVGDTPPPVEKKEAAAPEKARKVEELRWQEVDERQTMPRPYTFQVSSGGKQILFPKVNLSPVTPAKDAGLVSAPREPKAATAGAAPHALPSSLSIPHTAILVTGAQLCGPAVSLSQIKDVACKSLLGLSEERKHVDVPAVEHPPRTPGDARAGGGKARPPPECASGAAALAEWASIRSRILRNAESDARGDEPAPRGRCDSRGSLRKTPPANAKFSIVPAWQKFSEPGTEAESIRKRPTAGPGEETAPPPPPAGAPELRESPEKLEVHQEPADTTDGCKFAKDLPSFLVPSPPYPPQKAVAQAQSPTTADGETTHDIAKPDPGMPGGEEKASPFGIKLRRTNYSLRFHCDQQAEQKKKKRHSSTGDSVEGGPPAGGSSQGETETDGGAIRRGPSLPQERKQAPATRRDPAESPSPPAAQPRAPPASSQTPAPEHDKAANKMPLAQKPALAPKPASQTPPPSPLSKLSRPYLVELLARRAGKPNLEPSEPAKEGQQSSDPQPPSPSAPEERKGQKKDEEEEVTERKPASPPLSAAEQEKPSQTPEAGRKEKPLLQSRHSLDGSRLTEKVETAQPLWITLALQKQKGFREQQATREERKQAREAKHTEKLSKENVSGSLQPASGSGSRAGSLQKPTAPPEERKPETAASRLERREQLKKANTLPTSVTVEISDSAPPSPLVKEVTKRFSTPDAAPVSTEPAWLALAKRKAKAWSDCPQIIK